MNIIYLPFDIRNIYPRQIFKCTRRTFTLNPNTDGTRLFIGTKGNGVDEHTAQSYDISHTNIDSYRRKSLIPLIQTLNVYYGNPAI